MLSGSGIQLVGINANSIRNINSNNSGVSFHPRRGLYYRFFYKPKIGLSLLNVKRQTYNHINGKNQDAIVLEARATNNGRVSAKNARIFLRIKDVTSDYEIHPWQTVEFAHVSGAVYAQTLEVEILSTGYGSSLITSVSHDLDYAFTVTLSNQMAGQKGYKLELGREYSVDVMIAGKFKTKEWSFKIIPQVSGTLFSQPEEI